MTHAALMFLITRSTANRLKHNLSRLKQPRYLLSFLAGLAYLYFIFGFAGTGFRPGEVGESATDAAPVIHAFAGIGLLTVALSAWLLAPDNPTIYLSEPEAMQLFCAPLSRKQIIRYRWLRVQPALIFMGLLAGLIALRRPEINPLFSGLGAYLLVNVMVLHGMVASLATGKMQSLGLRGFALRIPGFALFAAVLGVFAANYTPMPRLRDFERLGPWFEQLFNGGAAYWLFWPVRQIALAPAASNVEEFLRGAAVAVVALLVFDQVATRLNTPFEENALELAQNMGRRMEAFRRGGVSASTLAATKGVKPSRFKLAEQGAIWRAMVWKSLVGQTRGVSARLMIPFLLFACVFGFFILSSESRAMMDIMVITMFSVFVIMLLMAGPRVLRNDLRAELQRLDYLKSLPVRGRDVLRGEVYGSAILIGVPLVFIFFAGALLVRSPQLTPLMRVMGVLTAACALPPIAALSFALENGAAVLMPSWVVNAPGTGGIEMMGRNMLLTFFRLVLMILLLAIPGGVLAGMAAAGMALYMEGTSAGMLLVPAGGVAFALMLLGEVELLILFFGRRLETLDPASERF